MSELDRFKRICAEILNLRLEPFQPEITKEVFSERRETLIEDRLVSHRLDNVKAWRERRKRKEEAA